ncbi:SRPBCC family protein [Streptomyces sp. NPDC058463]|uniref:SRPBCC family protein n=1 Tax=Streptomyces sp. NPDC058463 TaxID=3346510 RepID=UPI003652542C
MTGIVDEIDKVHREVGTRQAGAQEAGTVLLRRIYEAPAADVWDAVTSPERIGRWFLPVSGEFVVGGHYQLEGNAGGEILECVPPGRLRVSWLFGPEPGFSEVEVRLVPEGDGRTVLELEHVAVVPEEFRAQFGPGAVGIGWDLTLLGLATHLAGGDITPEEAAAWQSTPEAKAVMARSGREWGAAYAASGADPEVVAATTAATIAAYTGAQSGE